MTPTQRKLLFAAAGVAAGLLLAELALQLFSLVVPARMDILRRAQAQISIPDGRLGHRPNPDYPDHDVNDFYRDVTPSRPRDRTARPRPMSRIPLPTSTAGAENALASAPAARLPIGIAPRNASE